MPSAWSGRAGVADCLGLPASFEQFDIEQEPIRERFDYVLCLNLLHHMRNPLMVLDRLAAVTDERLILESATMGRHDRRRLRLTPFETLLLRRRPILYASRNGTSGKRNVQKFFVTPSAIENLLRYQSNAFARVDEQPSDHKNGTSRWPTAAGSASSWWWPAPPARAPPSWPASSRAARRPSWRRRWDAGRPGEAPPGSRSTPTTCAEFGEPRSRA